MAGNIEVVWLILLVQGLEIFNVLVLSDSQSMVIGLGNLKMIYLVICVYILV